MKLDSRGWLHLLILSLLFCCNVGETALPHHTFAGVISALKMYTQSGCVSLLYEGVERCHVVSLQKLLAAQGVAAAALDWSRLGQVQCKRNRALFAILNPGERTQRGLHQMSESRMLSGPTWLLFFNDSSIDSFLEGVDIPLDSEFLVGQKLGSLSVRLREVYRVRAGLPLLSSLWGRWSATHGLYPPTLGLQGRRADLQGIRLRVADIHDPPYTSLHRNDSGELQAGGYFNDVLKVLEKQLNFTSQHMEPPDQVYGLPQVNGSWTGMVGMLERGEVDLCVGAMVKTSIRAQVVDFSTTVLTSDYLVFLRKPGERAVINWSSFLQPFSHGLWLVLLLTTVMAALHCQVLSRLQQRFGAQEAVDCSEIQHAIFYAFRALICQQAQEEVPSSMSARISLLVMYLAGVTVMAAYSAALISSIAVRRDELPFSSAEALLADGSYQLGVHRLYALYRMFQEAKEGVMRDLYEKVMKEDPDNFPTNNVAALERICDKDRFAYLALFEEMIDLIKHTNCTIVVLPASFLKVSMSYTLPKNSSLLQMLNFQLNRLRNTGVSNKLHLGAWAHILPRGSEALESLRIQHVTPIIALLLLGAALSLLVLAIECRDTPFKRLFKKYRNKLKIFKTCPKSYTRK